MGARRLFLGCITSAIIAWTNLSAFGVDGVGTVYIPNQIDNPMLVTNAVLPNLNDAQTGFLDGTAATVSHPFAFDRALSATNEFHFNPNPDPCGPPACPELVHFAETMAYYHVATYDAYVDSLGFGAAPSPTPVIVFNGEEFLFPGSGLWIPAGTQYDANTLTVSLSMTGDVAQSDALDADLIVHEYAHAIQHQMLGGVAGVFVQPESDLTDQSQALMEALADFAAASWFDDPELGEWFGIINGFGDFARTMDNFRRWPGDFDVNEQTTGMIFGGAFWDLRSVIGATAADQLWLGLMSQIVDNNPATDELNTTFEEALTTLLAVAAPRGGTPLQDTIRQAFAAHGIGTYDFSTPFPMQRDPGNGFDGTQPFTDAGAVALVVTFDEFISRLEDSSITSEEFGPGITVNPKATRDELAVLDVADTVVGTFTGREFQGLRILVLGDTVKFHLTTDAFLPPFGYRVVNISRPVPGTFDADDDVDLLDHGQFVDCMMGPGVVPPDPACVLADFDGDGDVDADDAREFQLSFTGALAR